MVQESRHFSPLESGDLSTKAITKPHVVEARHGGGYVLVQLSEDRLARGMQPKRRSGGQDVVAVVAPRRLHHCIINTSMLILISRAQHVSIVDKLDTNY